MIYEIVRIMEFGLIFDNCQIKVKARNFFWNITPINNQFFLQLRLISCWYISGFLKDFFLKIIGGKKIIFNCGLSIKKNMQQQSSEKYELFGKLLVFFSEIKKR